MRGPADRIINAVPRGGGEQRTARALIVKLLDPRAEGVGVQHELAGSLHGGPVTQPHDLEDLQPLGGAEVRPALGRHGRALPLKHTDFPAQELRLDVQIVSNRGQSQDRRRMRGQSRSREHVALG